MVKVGDGLIVRGKGRESDSPPPVAVTVRVKLPADAYMAVITVSFARAVPGVMLAGESTTATPSGAPVTASFSDAPKPACTNPQLIWVNAELLDVRVRLAGAAGRVAATGGAFCRRKP